MESDWIKNVKRYMGTDTIGKKTLSIKNTKQICSFPSLFIFFLVEEFYFILLNSMGLFGIMYRET